MKSVQQLYAEKLRTPEEAVKIVKSGDWVDYSQTSSFPIALDEALGNGELKDGDRICLVGFGAGLTYGGILTEWPRV